MNQLLTRILLVEDQTLVAAALRQFFEPRFEIIKVVVDGTELERATRDHQPGIVVVNLETPGVGGLDGLRELRDEFPGIRIAVLAAATDAARVRATFAAGADAYLVKSSEPREFLFAIEEIVKGRSYVTPAATRALIEDPRQESAARSAAGEPLRVLLVDDQIVAQLGMEMLLEGDPGIEVVGRADNGGDGVDQALELEPDIVLMDLMMPKMNGAEATRMIRDTLPTARVLLTTTLSVGVLVLEALRAGAAGYLTKNVGRSELLAALHAVGRGETVLDGEITRRLLELENSACGAPAMLTAREIEIATQVAHGLSNQQVAEHAFVSEGTVRTHLRSAYEKLGVSNRVELTLHALRAGWASLDD